ncbi:hypothetical protein B0H14DRAFT_2608762 [Mycena olivaceomarginata]|nr:hypothetical protein B0H14DRAFT_2608762 [Mycena olivaceomarginata]
MTVSKLLTAPLTVIVGITGRKGGNVARALIASDKPYRLRGLSRNITKPAAQIFADQGVELVGVELRADKPEDVLKAFAGADIAFTMTNWNEYLDKAKARLILRLKSRGNSLRPCLWRASVIVMPGFYTTNICIAYYALKRQENGSYLFTLPISGARVVPLSDTVHDYGLYVQAAIEPPTLGAGSEIVAQLAQVSGKNILYKQVDRELWLEGFPSHAKFKGPILGDMFQTFEAAGYSFAMEYAPGGISFNEIVAQLEQVSGRRILYNQVDRESWLEGFPPHAKFMGPMLGNMFQTFEAAGFFGGKLPTPEDVLARKPRSWIGRHHRTKITDVSCKVHCPERPTSRLR